ncbi:MAG: PadR family transcriptional regulator [Solirubrobacteraceae bacterium]
MSEPSSAGRRSAARRAAREATRAATGDDAIGATAAPGRPGARTGGPGDPLTGTLRRAGLVRLLVLQLLADEAPAYGNLLIERIREQSGGLVTVNPNTMYPLLRALEEEGLATGEWEHPVRRSRRFYRLTDAGEDERVRLRADVLPALDAVAEGVDELRRRLGS